MINCLFQLVLCLVNC